MEGISDDELVARSRLEGLSPDRRREILDELFKRYQSRVALWCYRSTGDRNTAADLAQDILLRAWRNLDAWRGEAKFSTWMFSITRNHCRNYAAAQSVRPEGAIEPLDMDVLDRRAGPGEQWEQQFELKRAQELMRTALDETEARVMTLHYGDEMPLNTITRLLALRNQSGAKAYIVSAKRKLKAAIERLNSTTLRRPEDE